MISKSQKRLLLTSLPLALFIIGVIFVITAIIYDRFRPNSYPGFGLAQLLLVFAGIIIILLSLRIVQGQAEQGTWGKYGQIFTHNGTKKVIIIGWIIGWLVILLGISELAARRWLVVPVSIGQRPLQPYLMFGDFYSEVSDQKMLEREGPVVYGYNSVNNSLNVYNFETTLNTVSSRFDFLYQNRADLVKTHTGNQDGYVVFVIGGSAAYGTGASTEENRYYVVLENMLAAEMQKPVHIIPAAMGAYVSTQERIALELAVLPHKPDLVIIFDGFNDAALPAIYGNRPGDPYNFGVQLEESYSPSFISRRWLLNNSQLYNYWFNMKLQNSLEQYRQNILSNTSKKQNYALTTSSIYLDNVTHMSQSCREQLVPCLVFLQPAHAVTLSNQGIQPTTSIDTLTLLAYQDIQQQMKNLPPEIQVVDLTPVFDFQGQESWFYDWVHFQDDGHRRVAEAMFPVVLNSLRAAQ